MKRLKKFLFMFLIGLFFSVSNVNALVGPIENTDSFIFEHDGKVHVISDLDMTCNGVDFSDYDEFAIDKDGNYYFAYYDDSGNNGNFHYDPIYKVSSDNKCEKATEEEYFYAYMNYNSEDDGRYSYDLYKDRSGNVVIEKYDHYTRLGYYETTDTEMKDGKEYYENGNTNWEMVLVESNAFESGKKYYEKGYLTYNDNAIRNDNLTYYSRNKDFLISQGGGPVAYLYNILDSNSDFDYWNLSVVSVSNSNFEIIEIENQDAFEDFENYSYVEVYNDNNQFTIYIKYNDGSKVIKDLAGNVLFEIVEDDYAYSLGNNLHVLNTYSDGESYATSVIYFKNRNNKIIDVDKYVDIAMYHYSQYYNLGDAYKLNETGGYDYVNIIQRVYEIISGENQTYTDSNLEFKFSGDLDLFHRLLINDKEIEETNYTKSSGSTIINLKSDYLDTLDNGTYTLRVEYKDGGYVETEFTVAKDTPTSTEHSVIFDANGGTFKNGSSLTFDKWEISFADSLEEPTKDGYTFKGFYTEKTGGTKFEIVNKYSVIDSDMTFYAQWEENSAETNPTNPDEENPKTFDGIGTSIFMGTISLIGLVGATIYLKKRNKVRA